ncbi:MAG: hypothetical protein NTU83_14170, partial [Candidatus Hydrogenedentes bacterium]|nr:hypothetical protein [Candidatus Hydrogenedentota bacterium]
MRTVICMLICVGAAAGPQSLTDNQTRVRDLANLRCGMFVCWSLSTMHFGDCGGCKMQDVPYAEQLTHKSTLLSALFDAHWPHPIPVEPSPAIWHYRNKVDFSFGRKFYPEPPAKGFDRESVLGFKAKNRWYRPLDVEECRIAPQGMGALLDSVRRWMLERNL